MYIPTVFCSYSGETLDKKTPLLRSMEAINKEGVRLLNLLGLKDVTRVTTTVGPEQEYFLVDRKVSYKRTDLLFCGRTLFGAMPPKGQELEDHYFGAIKPRIQAFMDDLNQELWKLGIYAKTEHNEVAPAQHELAPIFGTTNVATDNNQLTMEILKDVARKHDLSCLLHEKPFDGINGSGKHNNWSLSTNTGINLLNPGKEPEKNIRFLLVLAAIIKAVDEYQDLLRMSCASAGNDHRLGASEAPPAIISMFIGDELADVLDSIENEVPYEKHTSKKMEMGVNILPNLAKDTSDRNRTSPFAFTNNKFEFRMLGSSFSIAGPNIILNTIVAESFSEFSDILEKADNIEKAALQIVRDTIKKHNRIIFNGNNYAPEWVEEAARRGLKNLPTSVDAIPMLVEDKNIKLFTKHGVYTETELRSRCEILLENYSKVIRIEALTMLEMARKQLLPAINAYMSEVANTAASKLAVSEHISVRSETKTLEKLSSDADAMSDAIDTLQDAVNAAKALPTESEKAVAFHDNVLPVMDALRAAADDAETICGEDYWPLPSYSKMLYYV